MKHINPPKVAKLYDAYINQRYIDINSRIIIDSTSIKCEDGIVLTINEFPDIRIQKL